MDRLIEEKLLAEPTIALLKERLAAAGWRGEGMFSLGDIQMTAPQLDETCQVNFTTFGNPLDTLDDMYGALGEATIKMAFVGRPFRDDLTGRDIFALSHVGFYIRDTYDFNGTQYLGTWTESGVLTKTQMAWNAMLDGFVLNWHGEPIGNAFNSDFSAYRERTGRGGDFLVFSDVHWRAVDRFIPIP